MECVLRKHIERLKKMNRPLFKKLAVGITVVVILSALFANREASSPESVPRFASTSGSNALELNVLNVNHVIARQFNMTEVRGVLINDVPKGTARRHTRLKRGDIILEYNNVAVQSADHLAYLMSQSHPGDTVKFLISRSGKAFSVSTKVPQTAGVDILSRTWMDILIAVVILILTFAGLFFNIINRTACVALGAVLMLVAGSIFGFYDQTKAFDSIRMSPILIFVGMSIFAIFLENLRFFEYAAKKMILRMRADVTGVVLALCLVTYFFSLFVNNLSTILVIIPLTLYISRSLKINPIPVVIAEIIASNIGGASTMIGDFPNMLISASTGLLFFDFLIFMAPICLILLLSLFWYMRRFEFIEKETKSSTLGKEFLEKMEKEVSGMKIDWLSVKRVFSVLACVVVCFMILPHFRIQSATIAITGGFILLALETKKAKDVIKKISFTDVLFFLFLFMIVGGALHSGLLKGISDIINSVSAGNKMLYLILLMWVAAFFTAFLNAGPATVFFIPIVMHSYFATYSDTVWWALSLGVLAGSSATITGATGGIVTQTILEESSSPGSSSKDEHSLSFSDYSKKGIPIALMFLVISTIYIMFLCSMPGVK